jgi:8-oxo-dGTP diphosphatase
VTTFDPNIIYAAGAVCWRQKGDEILVLVIHRTQRKDYSFPKGKVDPGELLPETCVREVAEETGLSISLGVPVGVTEYGLSNDKHKVVHYWAAKVSNKTAKRTTFVANDAVDAMEWLTIEKARKRLSYDPDRVILDNFQSLAQQGGLSTFALIVLRHAKALEPSTFVGKDQSRPLADRGRRQAQNIVPAVTAWEPKKLISSSSLRCRQTIEPLARTMSKKVSYRDDISQHAFVDDGDDVAELVAKRIAKKRTTVICSHGPVIPEIIREIAHATGTPYNSVMTTAAALDTASFSVFHVDKNHPDTGIVAVESHDSSV